ncbi:MAG TPA: hypothetical protein VLN56_04660 [Gammaproteobacteria bacterium]|nr:hypothetical protein [Gammaproteobacteria bacterium]
MKETRKQDRNPDRKYSAPGYVPNLNQGLAYLLKVPAHVRRMTHPVTRLRHFIQFRLERLILRGAVARLLVIVLALAVVSLAGGLTAFYLTGAFDDPYASVWWAFLRITDPGYLGDDEGTWLRVISVTMTICGLVLLIGALIAIMTQWLNQTIQRLEKGLTPIVMKNHVLILGWNNRTTSLVEQLLTNEGRVQRFLDQFGERGLKIVILAEEIGPVLIQELKDRLGPMWRPRQVILRTGNPMRLEHLERVDYRHAAAVVLPAARFGEGSGDDESIIKTLMTAGTTPTGPLPFIVAELVDPDHIRAGRKAYPGPAEIIAKAVLSGRILVQTARYPGLSLVIEDLFDQEGVQIYLHQAKQFTGLPLKQLLECFDTAIPIGIVRAEHGLFVPLLGNKECLEENDLVAVIGYGFEDSKPLKKINTAPDVTIRKLLPTTPAPKSQTLLIVGWNSTLPSLLAEFDHYPDEFDSVDIASEKQLTERERLLQRKGVQLKNIRMRQLECDFTARSELEQLKPQDYDTIMIVANDWLDSADEADAHSLLGYLMLAEILEEKDRKPNIIIEAMVESSVSLFTSPGVELLITPRLQSHMLAQVTMRRDLNTVFEHLFGAGGAELALHPAAGMETTETFLQLQRELAAVGEIALGIRLARGQIELNPKKTASLSLAADDQIIVLRIPTGR